MLTRPNPQAPKQVQTDRKTTALCPRCGQLFEPTERNWACPRCGSRVIDILDHAYLIPGARERLDPAGVAIRVQSRCQASGEEPDTLTRR